jgi:hypothetical protein
MGLLSGVHWVLLLGDTQGTQHHHSFPAIPRPRHHQVEVGQARGLSPALLRATPTTTSLSPPPVLVSSGVAKKAEVAMTLATQVAQVKTRARRTPAGRESIPEAVVAEVAEVAEVAVARASAIPGKELEPLKVASVRRNLDLVEALAQEWTGRGPGPQGVAGLSRDREPEAEGQALEGHGGDPEPGPQGQDLDNSDYYQDRIRAILI